PPGIGHGNLIRLEREFVRLISEPSIRESLRIPTVSELADQLGVEGAPGPTWWVDVRCETSFAVRPDRSVPRILSGIIDRLTLLWDGDPRSGGRPRGAVILDYKTDAFPGNRALWPEHLERRRLCHEPQLRAYTTAIVLMYRIPVDHIRSYLLFTSARTCVPVTASRSRLAWEVNM
ncbi:MAG: hypothetical protein Q4C47_01570, partial [Planctomycetia bacterium]|nr:hypothetical protein [Planctomycetia bacterium]